MPKLYRRNPTVEASVMKSEALLFDPGSKKFCLLNDTASFLWERLEHPATADQLVVAVCDRFRGVEPQQAASDVEAVLTQFHQLALVADELVADREVKSA